MDYVKPPKKPDPRGPWRRFLDAPAKVQVGVALLLIVILSGVVTAIVGAVDKAEANRHDVLICNDLDRLNDLAARSPNSATGTNGVNVAELMKNPAVAEFNAIVHEMVAESQQASPEIGSPLGPTALGRYAAGTFMMDPADARRSLDNFLQPVADACNDLKVPRR